MKANISLLKLCSNTGAPKAISNSPKNKSTQRPKEKSIIIKEVSTTNSDRTVARSQVVLQTDMRDKGKQKVGEIPSESFKIYIDPIFKNTDTCWVEIEEDEKETEEETQFQVSKGRKR